MIFLVGFVVLAFQVPPPRHIVSQPFEPIWNYANASAAYNQYQARGEMYYRPDGSIGYYPPDDVDYTPFPFDGIHLAPACYPCHSSQFEIDYCCRCHTDKC